MVNLITEYKYIHDNIHGYIPISNYAHYIINSEQFQRLRKIKQLGTCIYAFPNALHNRFIHSIGTYYLAGRILTCIMKNTQAGDIDEYLRSIDELQNYYHKRYNGHIYILDEYICELIKIAALCHDIGHGPFSHVFDDCFIPKVKKSSHIHDTHEERSKILLDIIIKKNDILSKIISQDDIEFMKNIINPTKNNKGFIYQIVSNSLNGLDIDKFDYIARDSYMLGLKSGFDHSGLIDHVKIIKNNITYPERVIYEIKKLYDTRYSLHKQIYNHKMVISSQLMIIELFEILDPILNLSKSVENMNDFCKLTDEYIFDCIDHKFELYKKLVEYDNKYLESIEILKKASLLVNRINNHDMYKFIGYHVSNQKIVLTKEDYYKLSSFDSSYMDKIIIHQTKIGFVSGDKENPLENIYTYSSKLFGTNDSAIESTKMSINDITLITPKIYQEYITMIFCKNNDEEDIEKIKKWSQELLSITNNGFISNKSLIY